ncbi:MAG: cupin-like domain-containing protein [Allosphingosinicella sp.]
MNILPQPAPVAEYRNVDRAAFEKEIRRAGQPAVLRGLGDGWASVRAARDSDRAIVDYVKRLRRDVPVRVIVAPPEAKGRFFYNEDVSGMNFTEGRSPLDPFLDRLLRDAGNPEAYAVAVQSVPVPDLLPGFEAENATDLVPEGVAPRIWMGNALRVAPHYDLMENIGVVVAGRRRFTLFPPEQIANLYPGPFEYTPAGTPVSMVELAAPDLDLYPRFADALAAAQVAELAPGDAIYIPFHWWHGVDSLAAVNIFVNYWWNEAPRDAGNPYDALIHALFALRTLPPDQRAAWRAVFDHYVFQTGGDPAAHLPPAARGVMGPVTPQLLQRMRATLKQILAKL